MNTNGYIIIGMLQDRMSCTVWAGTDRATRTECTLSVKGVKGKYGWENLYVKVRKEDLKAFVTKEITLLELVRKRIPGSLIVQHVNSLSGHVEEKEEPKLSAAMEAYMEWHFDCLRCADYEDIGGFLGIEIDAEV